MKKVLALLGLVLLSMLSVYYFFHEVVVVWFALALNMVKGVTLKAMMAWLFSQLYRWFLIEVPKKLVALMFILGMPRRWRIGVKLFVFRLKHLIDHTKAWIVGHYTSLFGKNLAVVFAVLASTIIFLVGVAYFGIYIIWFVGGPVIYEWIGWLWKPVSKSAQNILFKTIMFTKLDRLGRWIVSIMPKPFSKRLKSRWFGAKRSIVHQRRKVFGRSLKKEQKNEVN